MADSSSVDATPQMRKQHRGDGYATKFVEKSDQLQEKARQRVPSGHAKDGQPAGGYDDTPVPSAPPGWTIKFVFHRASNLPFADLNSLSSDPYLLAQLNTSLIPRHKQDPPLRHRSRTIRRSTDPVWDEEWIVANVPSTGFKLKIRIYDEDPADHDDRLGNVHVHVGRIVESWQGINEQPYDIKKRMGSKRAYFFRGCAAIVHKDVHMSGQLVVSAHILGRTDNESGGRAYTVGPHYWTRHYSPMIGRLAGTKDVSSGQEGKNGKKAEKYDFQANQMQLAGPVPDHLYHRYVEFKPFVAGMFNSRTLRGRILNRALHHQHARIYNYDRSTKYGHFPSPGKDMTLKFLELVDFDRGGRIYTYVVTLDGLWRFTQTGKEFGIDLLSKHTMHSDVDIYIAFSGEFFVRRLKNRRRDMDEQQTHPPNDIGKETASDTQDPARYELIIDNDSGTYRPNRDLLPEFKLFMERSLLGLKIKTLDCMGDKDEMDKLKKQQREIHKKEGRDPVAVAQGDADSISSSDEEALDNADRDSAKKRNRLQQLGHRIAEPQETVLQWAQGGHQREKHQEKDNLAAEVPEQAPPHGSSENPAEMSSEYEKHDPEFSSHLQEPAHNQRQNSNGIPSEPVELPTTSSET